MKILLLLSLWLASACPGLAPAAAAAEAKRFKVEAAVVEWTAKDTTGYLTIDGKGGTATGTVAKEVALQGSPPKDVELYSGTLSCELAAFKTGKPLRDEHMRDKFLMTAQFPTATLVIDPSPPSAWKGRLTIKGETKPVSGKADVKDDGTFTADFTLTLADFPAVGSPQFLKVELAKEIAVSVSGKLVAAP